MPTEDFNDLLAFVAVARERSFTGAARQIGVSQSALSHRMRALEARLGLRLLTRTTRSVSPTEAGERLLQTLVPRFEDIEAELAVLRELRDKPAGIVRITTAEHAANTVLWPKLSQVLPSYPELQVEINVDYGFTNIVAQRFDAGVRLGESLEKDMIAVRISPDLRMAVVATPDYFVRRAAPRTPQDLAAHNCINLRLSRGGVLAWEFERDGQRINAHVHSTTGAPFTPVITSTTRAGGSRRERWAWSWMRCGIDLDTLSRFVCSAVTRMTASESG